MDTQKIVIILLIVSIVLSGVSAIMAMGVDTGNYASSCQGNVAVECPASNSGQVSLTLVDPPVEEIS